MTAATNRAPFGSVESLAEILRGNNPDRGLIDSRTLAIIEVLVDGPEPTSMRLGFVRNALSAAELVRAELAEGGAR